MGSARRAQADTRLEGEKWETRATVARYPRVPGESFRPWEGVAKVLPTLRVAAARHREEPFDGILGVDMTSNALAALETGRYLNLPVATLAIGSDMTTRLKRHPALVRQLARILGEIDLPMGVSEDLCRRLAGFRCKRAPFLVALERDPVVRPSLAWISRTRQDLGFRPSDVVGVFAGGLTEGKGIDTLIGAARGLLRTHEHFGLLLLGDGPLMRDLKALDVSVGGPGRVVTPGWVDPGEVARLMSVGDFLVFPSRSEGLPQVVLEAMELALPVVATRVGGIPEIVVDGKNGELVDAADVGQLTGALARMIEDNAWRLAAARKSETIFNQRQRDSEGVASMARALKEMMGRYSA